MTPILKPPINRGVINRTEGYSYINVWLSVARDIIPMQEHAVMAKGLLGFIEWNGQRDITRQFIQEWIGRVAAESPKLVRTILRGFRWCFSYLGDNSPAADVEASPRFKSREMVALTEEQFVAVRRIFTQNYMDVDADVLVLLCWHCGLAYKDACELRWPSVDWQRLIIRSDRSKTSRSFTVPFSKDGDLYHALLKLLPLAEGPGGYVSHYNGTGYMPNQRTHIGRLRAALGSIGISNGNGFHTMRRGFVTRSVNSGLPAEVTMTMTGHVDPKMIKRYFKPDAADLHRALKRIEAVSEDRRSSSATVPIAGKNRKATATNRRERNLSAQRAEQADGGPAVAEGGLDRRAPRGGHPVQGSMRDNLVESETPPVLLQAIVRPEPAAAASPLKAENNVALSPSPSWASNEATQGSSTIGRHDDHRGVIRPAEQTSDARPIARHLETGYRTSFGSDPLWP